jgi:hypothetical protein
MDDRDRRGAERAAATARLTRWRATDDGDGSRRTLADATAFIELGPLGAAPAMTGAEVELVGDIVRIRLPTGSTAAEIAAVARRLRPSRR